LRNIPLETRPESEPNNNIGRREFFKQGFCVSVAIAIGGVMAKKSSANVHSRVTEKIHYKRALRKNEEKQGELSCEIEELKKKKQTKETVQKIKELEEKYEQLEKEHEELEKELEKLENTGEA